MERRIVGKEIEVTYQAAGVVSGLTDAKMIIYLPNHDRDALNFPDVTLTELGTSGRYYGVFTPTVVGEWTILLNSVSNPGEVTLQFTIEEHDINSVGAGIDSPAMIG